MAARSYRRYQWAGWGVMAAAFFLVFIHRFSPAAVADNLSREIGLSGTALSGLASVYFYMYGLMQFPTGLLSDSIGPRRSASAGLLVAAAGAGLFGLSHSYGLLLLGRALVGLGTSVVYVSLLRFQTQWFRPERFSSMTGFASLVGNTGAMVAAAPLAVLVVGVGWRQSFALMAGVSVVMAAAIYLLVRDNPAQAGLKAAASQAGESPRELWQGLVAVVRNPVSWLFCLVFLGAATPGISFSGLWGIPYMMQVYKLGKSAAATYTLFLSLGVALGAPVMGFLSDRWRCKRPIILAGTSVQGILWLLIVLLGPRVPLGVLPFLFFALGFSSIAFVLSFGGAKEANDARFSGTAISVVNCGGYLGSAVVNVLVGVLLDAGWAGAAVNGVRVYSPAGFRHALVLYPLCAALALVSALLLPERRGPARRKQESRLAG